MSGLPTSRAEAIARGVKRYQRSKPCKKGHMGAQWVHGGCCECRKENQESNRELAVLHTQAWRGRRYRQLALDVRNKADLTGVGCRLSVLDIMRLYRERQVCSITGDAVIPPGKGGEACRQAALRLIDMKLGWVRDNVQIVTIRAALSEGGLATPRFA
jgi:hypothetical protein